MESEIQKYKDALKKAADKIQELSGQIHQNKINEDIAIIGYGCRFPGGANNPELFWRILENGIDTVTEIPESRFSSSTFYSENTAEPGKMYTRYGAFLNVPVDRFDNKHFEIFPVEASSIDPQQRLLLEVSWEALENACLNIEKLKGSRTGVFIGINSLDYMKAHLLSGDVNNIGPYSITGISFNAVSGRLAYYYDFKGPSITVDTACSSSLVALSAAVESLRKNECDMAIIGGVNMLLAPESFIGLSKINGLSPDGKCKTFDAEADGFGRGEGCGVVILKRLSDARADQNTIHAIVKSVFVGQDGRTNGFTAPNGISQKNLIKRALDQASLSPDDIDYIEAHGAGTELGDLIEVQALSEVFKNREQNLLIGSVKTNIGHLEAAAGVAGLIKVILAIQHKKIPPHIHFNTPNPNIEWGNINVATTLTDWNPSGKKRRAGISSFGFTGALAHAIIEEPPMNHTNDRMQKLPYHLLTLSAKDELALKEAVNHMKAYLEETGNSIKDICYTSNIGKSYLDYRFAVSGNNSENLLDEIKYCLEDDQKYAEVTANCRHFAPSKIVFLFTGQGSIYPGIGVNLYKTSPLFKEALDLCDRKFQSILKISIVDTMFKAENAALLNKALHSQPVIFAVEYALTRIWESLGIKPQAVIGHSIGEFAAACYAGLLSLDDAVKMIAYRGKMMDSVAENGKMIGILANEALVQRAIQETGCQDVSIAAVNAPDNVTISGLNGEVDQVIEKIQQQRVFIDKLTISHPFHSLMMQPYMAGYFERIKDVSFAKPHLDIISTMTGKLADEQIIGNTQYWVNHLCHTVRFFEAMNTAKQMGYNIFIEIGGNATLSGLAGQCLTGDHYLFLPTLRKGVNEYKQLLNSLAALYLYGIPIDWNSFYAHYQKETVLLPSYPFQRKSFWMELRNNTVSPMSMSKVQMDNHSLANSNAILFSTPDRGFAKLEQNPEINLEQIKSVLKQIINLITGLETDDIRTDINLFSLGFDSLLLVQFKKRIDNKYGLDISLNEFLMELNTVEKIAQYIHDNMPESSFPETAASSQALKNNHLVYRETNNEFPSFIGNQIANISQQLEYIKNLTQQKYQFPSDFGIRKIFPKVNSRSMIFEEEKLTAQQKEFISNFTVKYNEKTKQSKEYAATYNSVLSDWVGSLNFRTTLKEIIYPVVSRRSQGSRFWDIDGNEYIDIAIGYGVHYFGHNPDFIHEAIVNQLKKGFELGPQSELAGKVAELIKELTGVERVAFSNTGSEAVMIALRIARAARKKDKVVMFAGSYHGIFDGVLTQTDDEGPFPISPGTPYNMVKDMVTLIYGSKESLDYIEKHHQEIAAVLVEPVQSRKPSFQPRAFLTELRDLTARTGIVLIFDEMINGFRIQPGGAQAYFGIRADLVTYGKIVGGGMPIGVVAGKKEYLDAIDGGCWYFHDLSKPDHETVTFAGTFCKHPLTMAAAFAVLSYMKQKGESLQQAINEKTELFVNRINRFFEDERVPIRVRHFGSQFRFESYGQYDLSLLPIEMDLFFYLLMYKGIYTWERRICCFCTKITENDIEIIIQKIKESIYELREGGFSFSDNYFPVNIDNFTKDNSYIPMSTSQKRLFTLSQVDDKDPYHIIGVIKIKGKINASKLEIVFKSLIRRHESLRTRLLIENDELLQEILPDIDFKVEMIQKDPTQDLDELLDDLIGGFDLAKVPLIKVSLIEISPDENVLLIDLHHTIADGFSLNILAQEFMKLYMDQKLDPVKKQYRDYVFWEKDFLNSAAIKECEAFWLQEMSGEIVPLDLPLDYKRSTVQHYSGNTVKMKIEPEIVKNLKNLAKKTGTSLFMVLISAFTILLQKLSGQEEIFVGTPTSNRNHSDFEQGFGMFTNTIVLRNYPTNQKKYQDFLNEVKENCLEAYSYMDYPFDLLVNKVNIKRDNSRNPLFDVMFVYENTNERILQIGGLELDTYDYKLKTAMFDLTLEILEEKGFFNVNLNYRTDLFTEDTIARWGQYYQRIINTLFLNPEITLSDIQLLGEDEKNQLIHQFNRTEALYPREMLIHQLFEEQVAKTPDNIAVIFKDTQLTYRELNGKTNQLARYLRNKGVKAESIVGIMVERSLEMIIGIMGILKAGGAYLPIDPGYPEERIEFMLEDSGVTLLLSHRKFDSIKIQDHIESIFLEDELLYTGDNTNLAYNTTSHNLVYVIYTSGSTGKPKGSLIEHHSLINRLTWMQKKYPINQCDTILQKTPFTFDVSVWEMFWWSLRGARVCFLEPGAEKDPGKIVESIEKNRITVIHFVPSMLNAFLEYLKVTGETRKIASLKQVFASGEALTAAQVRTFKMLFGKRTVKLANLYGPTEATIDVSYFDCITEEDLEIIPIGKPIDNIQLLIFNKQMQLQPVGVAGELYIAGVGLARGYLNREKLTREKFVVNPLTPSPKMYRTGDLAKWRSDGNIEFLGRIDHQVKIRGFRIELGEIESRLLTHEMIKEAVVIVKENSTSDKYLCAYIVAKKELKVRELQEYLGQTLPEFMFPSYFVQLPKLPLTQNGKIDRKALPEPDRAIKTGTKYEVPVNEVEVKLAEVWREVLGIERIGVNNNFFELGGHSLKATILASKIHQACNVEVPLQEIFQKPTISELAKYITQARQKIYSAIEPAQPREYYPVSSAQKRLLLLDQFEDDSIAYNMPEMFIVEGELDKLALERAFQELIKRHESLRTFFEFSDGEPVQRILPAVEFKIEYGETESIAINQIIAEFIKPFDLRKAPLLRIKLISTGINQYLLIFDMHHIISDGTSMGILIRELTETYQEKELSPLRIQYKDYAVWQNEMAKTGKLKTAESYWLKRFQGELPVLNFPLDYPRPAFQSFEGNHFEFTIEAELTGRIKELAQWTNTTLYMILLAGYNVVLSRYTGQEDIIIGSPVAGRPHADFHNIIGMFVNTLAMRNYPVGTKIFLEFVEDVKRCAIEAYEHQDYQFEELVEKVQVSRDLSRNPLFDVMFVLQNMDLNPLEIPGLKFKPYEYENRTAKFDLTLSGQELADGISFNLEYCSKLFTQETIRRLAGHYQKILREIAVNPNQRIADIEMLTEREKRQLLYEFNNTVSDYPKEKTIQELFEEQVERTPENIAVVYENQKLTYRELNQKANQLAHGLRSKGVGPDNIIGIMVERSLEMIIGILGVLKAGGAYLPIDPEYPEERTKFMLEDSKAAILLTQKEFAHKGDSISGITKIDLKEEEIYSRDDSNLEGTPRNTRNLAYVIYTSGSTGKPKGVMIEHCSVHNFIRGITDRIKFRTGKTILVLTTISFDIFGLETLLSLTRGLRIIIATETEQSNPQLLSKLITKHKIQMLQLTPSRMQMFLADYNYRSCLKHLTEIMIGGEVVPESLVIEIRKLTSARIYNMYGPTETTIWSTVKDLTTDTGVNIGTPIANTRIYIVDHHDQCQPIGVVGELCISGDGLARGYLEQPELTQEKFVLNPFEPGKRMYRTGDLARWLPDGNIEFLGRIDYQVKIRGFRIELGEIENQLLRHRNIKEAVVIETESQGYKYLCAYLVIKEEMKLSELREYLATNLPDYMIPSYFVKLEKLPLTPNGKIDRKGLPKPDGSIIRVRDYVAPANDLEEQMVQIWQEVLGIEKISVNENFFELGGDSIKAIQVTTRLYNHQLKSNVRELFKNPTIELFTKCVSYQENKISQEAITGEIGLTPVQKWFFESRATEKHHFNQSIVLYRNEGFETNILSRVFDKIIEHHDALRMVYQTSKDHKVVQYNRGIENGLYDMKVIDLATETDYEERVEAEANQLQKDIDLARGPLIKLGLFKTKDGDHLLIVIHHLVIDGVSWRILVEDLMTGYLSVLQNKDIILPWKTHSFKEWSEKLQQYANSKEFLLEKKYWGELERQEVAALFKNTFNDRRGQAVRQCFDLKLSPAETEKLLKQVNAVYNTEINDILLTALGLAVKKVAGEGKVLIQMEGHGREEIIPEMNITRTIGWFTSIYPVVLDINPDEKLSFTIKHVKESLRRIPAHGIGYGILKYLTAPENKQDINYRLKPEISFNYLGQLDQNTHPRIFALSKLPTGEDISPKLNKLKLPIDIKGMIVNNELVFTVDYSTHEYHETTIAELVHNFRAALLDIIEHCIGKGNKELTPSDFENDDLNIEELNSIFAAINKLKKK